jgi:hypothetical protein
MNDPVTWSGAVYSFAGAGAYVGMAACDEHYSVARMILPRQGWVYAGGGTRFRQVERIPTVYYAIRDPSIVRIVPVQDPRSRPRRHVLLGFDPRRESPSHPAGMPALEVLKRHCEARNHGVFIVTVGLAIDEEDRFFNTVVLACEGRDYGELCDGVQGFRPDDR